MASKRTILKFSETLTCSFLDTYSKYVFQFTKTCTSSNESVTIAQKNQNLNQNSLLKIPQPASNEMSWTAHGTYRSCDQCELNKLVLDDDQDTSASPSDGTSNSYLIFWL